MRGELAGGLVRRLPVLDAAHARSSRRDARVGALGWAQRAIVCPDAACARAADRAFRRGSSRPRYFTARRRGRRARRRRGRAAPARGSPSLTGLAVDVAHWAVTAHAAAGGGGGGRDGGLKCVCSEMDVAWLADPSAQLAVEPARLETGLAGMADVVLPTNVELRTFNIGFWVAWPSPGVAGFLRNVTAWWAAALAARPTPLRDAGARLADQREFNRWRASRAAPTAARPAAGPARGRSGPLPWGCSTRCCSRTRPYACGRPRCRRARIAPLVFRHGAATTPPRAPAAALRGQRDGRARRREPPAAVGRERAG